MPSLIACRQGYYSTLKLEVKTFLKKIAEKCKKNHPEAASGATSGCKTGGKAGQDFLLFFCFFTLAT